MLDFVSFVEIDNTKKEEKHSLKMSEKVRE